MSSFEALGFTFYAANPAYDETFDFVAVVPRGIRGTDSLLKSLFDSLVLPGYFGFNWNALSDCLRDLSWIKQFRVVLLHLELPELPETDLTIYLEILRESVRDWKGGNQHELVIAFPIAVRELVVESIAKNPNPPPSMGEGNVNCQANS